MQRATRLAVTFMASLSSRTSGWVNISVAVFAAIDKALVSLMSDPTPASVFTTSAVTAPPVALQIRIDLLQLEFL